MSASTDAVIQVPIGGIVAIRAPGTLSTLLGSCVGLVLQDMRSRVVALAHVVRAHGTGAGMGPGYFANQAFPRALDLAIQKGADRRGLVVRLAGGGQMLGNSPGTKEASEKGIGESTVDVLREATYAADLIFGGFIAGPRDGGCFLVVDAGTGRATARPLASGNVTDQDWNAMRDGAKNPERSTR